MKELKRVMGWVMGIMGIIQDKMRFTTENNSEGIIALPFLFLRSTKGQNNNTNNNGDNINNYIAPVRT